MLKVSRVLRELIVTNVKVLLIVHEILLGLSPETIWVMLTLDLAKLIVERRHEICLWHKVLFGRFNLTIVDPPKFDTSNHNGLRRWTHFQAYVALSIAFHNLHNL